MIVKPPPASYNSPKKCQNMAGWGESERRRKNLDESRILKGRNAIENIASTVASKVNPVKYSGHLLINIYSVSVASANVRGEKANGKGVNAVKNFEESRLKSQPEKLFVPIR